MGACFNTMSVPASLSKVEITKRFESAQDQDRYENGHCYSGGFGMAEGLTFSDKQFADVRAAEDYLSDTCVKWRNAIAVKHKNLDGSESWLIGALCAS